MSTRILSRDKIELRLESIYDYERQPMDGIHRHRPAGRGRGQLCPGYNSGVSAPWQTSTRFDFARLHCARPLNGFPDFC
jgi:hypothetical protein